MKCGSKIGEDPASQTGYYVTLVLDKAGQPIRACAGFLVEDQEMATVKWRDVRGLSANEVAAMPPYRLMERNKSQN